MKEIRERDIEEGVSTLVRRPLKPFIKPGETIVGGGIALIFGIVFLTQPFPTYMLLPDFIAILRIFGLLTMIESSIDI